MSYRAKTLYKNRVAKDYDKERFSFFKGKLYDFFEKQAIKRLLHSAPKEITTILDIPCGTGRITKYLHDLGYNIAGADISKDMITIAMTKVGVYFSVMDIENIPYDKKFVGITICNRLMGHLPYENKVRVLQQLKKISNIQIVTFYFPKKKLDDWYPVNKYQLNKLLRDCGLRVITKTKVCPLWSDGVVYSLHE